MPTELPAYYSGLAPFRAVFRAGNPILTYHKLGPRPTRVRLKGLYVSAKLFVRQLAEFKSAGFASGSLDNWKADGEQRLILTFDDGYVNVLRYGLRPLADAGFNAIQFLPVNYLGKSNEWDAVAGEEPESIMDVSQINDWLSAGHAIGSHSLSHPFLTRISLPQAREEVTASRKKLEDLFGRPVRHFCYPYGDWNESVRDLVQQAGYVTACATEPGINGSDTSPFTLKRFTARYPSRRFKSAWAWIRARILG